MRMTNGNILKRAPGISALSRVFILLILFVFSSFNSVSQELGELTVFESIELSPMLSEISGITFSGTKVYAINDSGNTREVHILNDDTFEIESSWKIPGTKNIDWEDISYYNNFLYIGDFGNNFGNRKDLSIYKISIDSLSCISCKAENIEFNYLMQNTYKLIKYKKHIWDCEAMLVDSRGLWLFSKDWDDRTCRLYSLDNNSQTDQKVKAIDSLNLAYLVTGAYYETSADRIILCGYEGKNTFVTVFTNIDRISLSSDYQTYTIKGLEYAQVESIFVKENIMYLASERSGALQAVYKVKLPEGILKK